jgi:hypothetical protein
VSRSGGYLETSRTTALTARVGAAGDRTGVPPVRDADRPQDPHPDDNYFEGVPMANELDGLRIAFMVANEGIEQVELTEPWQAVKDAGATPELNHQP